MMSVIVQFLTCSFLLVLFAAGGCDDEPTDPPTEIPRPAQPPGPAAASPTATTTALPRVVFLGDSLTAGHALSAEEAFPAVVGEMLEEAGTPVQVINGGVSGDTTAGGLSRLDWLLRQSPDVVVVGLGANDGLRGIRPEASEQNLRVIIQRCRDAGADVLLLGMMIPPNYGPEYTEEFRALYPRLAAEMDVPMVPFLLEGVGGVSDLNMSDGIHPTAAGHKIVARNVLPHLRDLLDNS